METLFSILVILFLCWLPIGFIWGIFSGVKEYRHVKDIQEFGVYIRELEECLDNCYALDNDLIHDIKLVAIQLEALDQEHYYKEVALPHKALWDIFNERFGDDYPELRKKLRSSLRVHGWDV